MIAAFLIASVIILLCVLIVFTNDERIKLVRQVPGPKAWFLIGNMLEILVPPDELFSLGRKFAAQYERLYSFWTFGHAVINIYNPEDIETIVSTMKHHEKSDVYRFLESWLGDGLLLSSKTKWQIRRKILTPAFHFNILRQFFAILQENSRKLTDTLAENAGKPIDIVPVLSDFTLHSICETAMGTKLRNDTSTSSKSYKKAIYELGQVFVYRFSRIFLQIDFLFNLTNIGRKAKDHIKTVHDFTENVIKERKEYIDKNGIEVNCDVVNIGGKRKIAMLDLMILAEKDGLIDKSGIQEEVDTFMFEGHDTTASGLTHSVMSLANNAEIQDKVIAELDEIFGDSKRLATQEDLNKLKYLDCCIKEGLRLYPPVHFISRTISETVQLSNYTIAPGTQCHIHIYDLHRKEEYFKNPLVFDPDRFLPENCVGRHPYAYIPFSAGPRNCIGQKFAIMEMKLALSSILREYRLLPVTKTADIRFASDLVLRNTGPVYVTFVKRGGQ